MTVSKKKEASGERNQPRETFADLGSRAIEEMIRETRWSIISRASQSHRHSSSSFFHPSRTIGLGDEGWLGAEDAPFVVAPDPLCRASLPGLHFRCPFKHRRRERDADYPFL